MSLEVDNTDPAPVDFKYHAFFNDQDSDLLLVSSDRIGFCVHSQIMKLASEVFRTMIDSRLAQSVCRKEPIHLQESSVIFESILSIIYPTCNSLSLSTSSPTFDRFKELCYAAEKLEMFGVLDVLRIYLRSMVNTYPPLPAFALASHYKWSEELCLISTATLSINLQSKKSMEQLEAVPLSGVSKLLALHRKRRDLMVASLDLKHDVAGKAHHYILWSSVRPITTPRADMLISHPYGRFSNIAFQRKWNEIRVAHRYANQHFGVEMNLIKFGRHLVIVVPPTYTST